MDILREKARITKLKDLKAELIETASDPLDYVQRSILENIDTQIAEKERALAALNELRF